MFTDRNISVTQPKILANQTPMRLKKQRALSEEHTIAILLTATMQTALEMLTEGEQRFLSKRHYVEFCH